MADNELEQETPKADSRDDSNQDDQLEASIKQPTSEEQNVNPEDEANATKADEQARAAGGQTPEGQTQATAAPQTGVSPEQQAGPAAPPQTSPQQMQVAAQRAAEQEHTDHTAGLFRRAAEAMAGGPQTSYKFDGETGKLVPTTKPLTRGQIAMGIIAQVLGGMGAGSNARNPMQAIGQGFQYGRSQRQEQDQAAQQKATDEWKRKVQVMQTNFQLHSNAMIAGKQGYDAVMNHVNIYKPYYETLQKIEGAITDYAYGDELPKLIASGKVHSSRDNAIPIGVEEEMNADGTGQKTDANGVAQWRTKYAIIDSDKLSKIPKETLDYLVKHGIEPYVGKDGKPVNIPENAQLRASTIVHATEKAHEHELMQNMSKGYSSNSENEGAVTSKPTYNTIVPMNKDADQFIISSADKYGIDANLLRAVMNQESQGNPKAVSPKGAQGLMQIMPYNQKGLGITDPFDPQQNIDGGAKMLAGLMKEYNGDVSKVLSVYNGGTGALTSPKPETTNYVSAITSKLGDLKTTMTTPPSGLSMKPWTDSQMKDLSNDDYAVLRRFGSLDPFMDGISGKSTVDKQVALGKVNAESVAKIKSMIQSSDGKLVGQNFIDKYASGKEIQQKVELKTAETKATGEAKKALTDPQVEAAAQDLVTPGSITTLKEIGGMAGDLRTRIFARAKELAKENGTTFSPGDTTKRAKFIDQYENPNGASFKNRSAINNMIQHGADLVDINNEYRRSNVQVLNTGINNIRKQFGDSTYVRYKATLDVLKGEARLFFAGGYAPTADQEKMWDQIVSDKATPAQIEAFAKEITTLGLRRADTFNSQFKTNMGYDDPNMITPSAKEAANKLVGNDTEGRILKDRLDKLKSGGMIGLAGGGGTNIQATQIPQGNGQKLNPADPASTVAFKAAMKAAGDDPVKAKQMLQDAKWVF